MPDQILKVDDTTFKVSKDAIVTPVSDEILTIPQANSIINLVIAQISALDAQYKKSRQVMTDKVAKYQDYIAQAKSAGVSEVKSVPDSV